MSKSLLGRLLVASAALALASCGGGGGGSSGIASTPPPPPPPPPTTQTCPDGSVIPITSTCPPPPPPPPALSAVFAGVTTSTEFATLGLEAGFEGEPASALDRSGFSVRYDATSNAYIVDLPSTTPGKVQLFSEDSRFWHGFHESFGSYISVFKPSPTNPDIALAYTSYGISSGYWSSEFGFTAFGLATPSGGVPLTGTATYDAHVAGRTLTGFGLISGDATLTFNFGSGSLAGHFDPMLETGGSPTLVSLGRYDFINTVFGAGSTTFSGGLSRSGINSLGAFDGRFTGPAAQELMARWTAPYINPSTQQPGEMFGVWVGRRP